MSDINFDDLVNQFGKKIFNLGYRITGCREDAEEVVQETFLKVFKNINKFKGESSIFTWIYKIALNHSLVVKRKIDKSFIDNIGQIVEMQENNIPDEVKNWFTDPEKSYLINEMLTEIRSGCLYFLTYKLSDNQRIVYLLRYSTDLTIKEIAEILGINEGIVKGRLNRAINKLESLRNQFCARFNPNYKCDCKKKIGFALSYDLKLLDKIKEQAKNHGYRDLVEDYARKEIMKKFPEFDFYKKINFKNIS